MDGDVRRLIVKHVGEPSEWGYRSLGWTCIGECVTQVGQLASECIHCIAVETIVFMGDNERRTPIGIQSELAWPFPAGDFPKVTYTTR